MDNDMPYMSISETESSRFGVRIARGIIPSSAPVETVVREIRSLQPDVAIVRLAAGDHRPVQALIEDGLIPLHADTLVYYETLLANPTFTHPDPSDLVRVASPSDAESLAHIARRSFVGYRSHYHANPRFSTSSITEGYVEWALSYLAGEADGRRTWVVEASPGKVVGFATCNEQAAGMQVEIVLNATDPAHMRAGHYSRLLRGILDYYRRRGFVSLCISTQVWNFAVQRVWARAGLVIRSAFDTYHINLHPGR